MNLNKIVFFLLSIFLYLGLIFLTGCKDKNKKKQEIVARIGNDYIITYNELRKYVFENFYHKQYKDESEAYNQALKTMITKQLKCIDFFEKGLDKNKELVQKIQRFINEELIVEYFNTQFLGKYTSDEFALKTYERMGKQVLYQQIVLNKPEKATQLELDSLEKKATEIKTEIEKGIEFNKLITQYSQYIKTSNSDVNISQVGWEQSIANPVDNVIFGLKAGDVRIIEAYNTFHIVKVIEIKKVDVEPFNKIKDELITKLKRGYLDKSLQEFYQAQNDLFNVNELEWNKIALDQLIAWSKIPRFYIDIYKDTLQYAITHDRNLTILTYPDGKVDFKEYLRLLNDVLIPVDTRNISEEDFKNFIIEAIRTNIFVKKAQALDLEKEVFNYRRASPVLKYQIERLYDQAVVESQILEASIQNLNKFYDEQKDSLYYQLEKKNFYVMIFPHKEKAIEATSKINDGIPFEKITGRYLVKTYFRDRDGIIKSYKSKEKPLLGETAFKMNLNEIIGPIQYNDPEKGEQYAIFKCVNTRPEKQLYFDDVKNTIGDDFKNYQRKKLMTATEADLWKKYNIEINEDLLSQKIKSNH
jgi:parvulin-like peptidyl-prolyl isomerase